MRGQTCFCQHYGIFRATHGGIAYPPNPRRSFGRNIQREMPDVPYIRAGAYAPVHDFTASRKIALKRRVASLIYGRLRGTFPLGLPECIRQTALPSVRGPDRARGCAAGLLVSNIMP